MTVPVEAVSLATGVGAWFTGRPPDPRSGDAPLVVGRQGNLSHRRPHLPSQLARDRADAFARMDLDPAAVVWMRQVHGGEVAIVDAATPRGAEVPGVDAIVTATVSVPLAVQVADCVPVLLASEHGPVGAVHVGRRGLAAGVLEHAVATFEAAFGVVPSRLAAALGPAIGGCCYEVPAPLIDQVAAQRPQVVSQTTWGTPSLDLPTGVATILEALGARVVSGPGPCTRCTDGWFSHRADPSAGRQLGVVVVTG